MRQKGSKTNKLCWDVLIKQGDIELHHKQYSTLRQAGDDLGLTYSQICELGPNGRNKKKGIRFKFYPDIHITKINLNNLSIVEDEDKDDEEILKQ